MTPASHFADRAWNIANKDSSVPLVTFESLFAECQADAIRHAASIAHDVEKELSIPYSHGAALVYQRLLGAAYSTTPTTPAADRLCNSEPSSKL